MNGFTWTDENVREILAANFLFWQRGHTTVDAKTYMSRYNVTEPSLPHVGIVDPRSGVLMLSITGHRSPEILSEQLIEFLDENDVEKLAMTPSSSESTPQQQEKEPTGADHIFSRCQSCLCPLVDYIFTISRPLTLICTHLKISLESSLGHEITPTSPKVDTTAVYDPMILYGSVPKEPNLEIESATRILVKGPRGRMKRAFLKSDKVRSLYAVVANDPISEGRPFELGVGFPRVISLNDLDQSLKEAGLLNSQIVLKFK